MTIHLRVLPGTLAICRLGPDEPVPAWAGGPFVAITRTPDELSVVCDEAGVPGEVRAERGWRALQVAGPLDFGLTGVLAGLTTPLAAAGVPVFAISSFDTDYLLVRGQDLSSATRALQQSGCTFAQSG